MREFVRRLVAKSTMRVRILKARIKGALRKLYVFFRVEDLRNILYLLAHRYRAQQFNPTYYKANAAILSKFREGAWLDADSEGRLSLLESRLSRLRFRLKNWMTLGAFQARVERSVAFTFTALTLEYNNPFSRTILKSFLRRKIKLLLAFFERMPRINDKRWNRRVVRINIDLYHRSSVIQDSVTQAMQRAVRRQKEIPALKDAQRAIEMGLHPLLITAGASGSYWIRNTERGVAGLFKPYDEEILAPHNPGGPKRRGALGQRATRRGCRTGEAAHHEVGAFLVDKFFGFGIVPRTCYAMFTHQVFYYSHEDVFATHRLRKTKIGSFMEFVGGFVPFFQCPSKMLHNIPLDEFQLMVVLDVILGNTDRNAGNFLVGDEKLAAIDHGLCFTDVAEDFKFWYWKAIEHGKKPLYPAILDLLKEFPFEKLAWKLKKRCFISWPALYRMRERVVLFREAVLAGLVPADIEGLMQREYLVPLLNYDRLLPEKAREQVELYQKSIENSG